ncbi:FapA family protein [Anoxynatronum sibiricum]|uniref:FapA family protein n=1 Tax=Anoxynatronum sibiricum TaxID=210623 RepID=A0ABU9VQG6_9CLOT
MTEVNDFNISEHKEPQNIDGEVKITLSPDRMEATMLFTEPVGEGRPVTVETVTEALKAANVAHGIDRHIIEEKVAHQHYQNSFVCARGERPVDGEAGQVVYHFNIEEQKKPSINEDGTVDFKNLDLIENVRQNDLLAEQILPTEGVPGTDVTGKIVPQKSGKPARFQPGKFVELSSDSLQMRALADGQVFIRDGKITVSPVYQVPANVDNTTGNIRFNGKVLVKGNVKSGFVIEADGDIEVEGVVEGAILKSNSNIVLKRGIQGNNQAELYCKGDLIARYIENTKINAGGNVEADCILHSVVYARRKILIKGKKGLIVGGVVKAGEEIVAQVIGSSMGTQTQIEVGIDPNLKEKYDQAKAKLKETVKNLENLKQTIEILNKMNKNVPLPPLKKDMLVRSVKTYEVMKDQQLDIQREIVDMDQQMEDATKGKIHASQTIYPGVRISIYNAVKHVYDDLAMCTLFYREGDVAIGMYEK